MTMNGEVTLASLHGERRVSLNEFFQGPGTTDMGRSEILTSIHIPAPPSGSGASYKRISARCGVDIAAVCVGAWVLLDGQGCTSARIVLGAVAPVPMRAVKTESVLAGQSRTPELLQNAGDQAAEEAKPISDMRASAQWRKQMVAVLTRRALDEAFERACKG
jgi:carbon-monoxide dehydrogenase medium subunit